MAEVPSAGGGKIRPRRTASSRKPYSRASSQRKSLFSRVTDSVKTLLNPITPKWLTSRLHHSPHAQPAPQLQQPKDSGYQEAPSTSANHHTQHHTNNNYKKSPLTRPPLSEGMPSSSPLQYYVTPPDTPPVTQEASVASSTGGGGKQDLLKHLEMSSKRHKMSFDPPSTDDGSALRKGMDRLKTNDEGSVASSSGCSSSMQASQRTNTSDQDGSQRNLWSSSLDSLASSRQQTTMSSHKRPRFNPAVFGMPALGASSRTPDVLQSSFYNGPIQYGGANATERRPYFATPYKIPAVTKVKVRHLNHQRTPARSSVSSHSSRSPLNDTDGGMSSTARKILQTLERMPSPLNDARKIPYSVTRSPSVLLAERHRRRTIGGPSLSTSVKAPPTVGLFTPSAIKIRKRVNIPLNNSLTMRTAVKITNEESRSKFVPESCSDDVIPDSELISTRGLPAPFASLSSTASLKKSRPHTSADSGSGSGGGKIRTQKRSSAHYSAMHEDEEEVQAPNLPAVALPLTMTSNLPSFDFGKSAMTSTPLFRMQKPNIIQKHNLSPSDDSKFLKDPAPVSQPEFNFAAPVVKTTNIEQPQLSVNTPKFQFISPPTRSSSKSHEQETPKSRPSSNFNSGSNPSTPSLVFAPDPKLVSDLRATKRRSSPPVAEGESAKPVGGAFRPAEELKVGSVMDVLAGGDVKKSSGNTLCKNTSQTNSEKDSNLKTLTQVKSGWDCGTCMVRNDPGTEKCAACETPNPLVRKQVRFEKTAKAWDCDTCLIRNDPGTEKCAACETPRPGSAAANAPKGLGPGLFGGSSLKLPSSSGFSFGVPSKNTSKTDSKDLPSGKQDTWGSSFKKPSGTWDCGTCLVPNDSSNDRCEACQAIRPGSDDKSSTNRSVAPKSENTSAFKFGIPSASTSETKPTGWGLPKNGTETWECDVCMVRNSLDRRTCEACESPKPGTEKLDTSFKFGSASSGLFKFGVPATSKESEPEQKKEEVDVKQENKPNQEASTDSKPGVPATVKPSFSFGLASKTPSTSVPTFGADPKSEKSAPTFSFGGNSGQSEESKKEPETKKPLFNFGAPKTLGTSTQENAFDAKVSAAANTTSVGPPVAQLASSVGTANTNATPGLPGFNPMFAGTTSQAPPAFGTGASTQAAISAVGGILGGFKTNNADSTTKAEEPKPAPPAFSFGASKPAAGAAFQFTGASEAPKPAPPKVGFSFGSSQSSSAPSTASNKPAMFGGFGSNSNAVMPTQPQAQDSSKSGFSGFQFGSSQPPAQSALGGIFGSATATASSVPFGTDTTKATPFGAPAANPSPFGNAATTGGSASIFGTGNQSKSAFGTPTVSKSSPGIPKPSFSFGASSTDTTQQKPGGGFTGFQFNANIQQTKTNPPPSTSGFAFGGTPSNNSMSAFNATPSTGFQFGAPVQQQQQSNGVFQFGAGSNQPKPEPASENKSGMFVFGASNQGSATSNHQQSSTGFSFGASANTGGFNFSGSQPPTPQNSGANMFGVGEAPPNQNPFSASTNRSTTPVHGRRIIRQARRKLRK